MRKLYEKNELRFAIAWIVVYCVLQSLANPLNKAIGIGYEPTTGRRHGGRDTPEPNKYGGCSASRNKYFH